MINYHTQTKEQLLQEIELLKSKINGNKYPGNENSFYESIYKGIAEESDDLISLATFDLRPKFLYANANHTKILGYNPNELIGKLCFDFIHPADRKNLLVIFRRYIAKKVRKLATGNQDELKEHFSFRILDKANKWHHADATIKLINDNKMLIILKDISNKKNVENIHSVSNGSMDFLANSGLDLLHLTSVQSIYDYVAKKIHSLLNHTGFIVIVDYDHKTNSWTSRCQEGFNPYLQKLAPMLGFDFSSVKGTVDKNLIKEMSHGKLTKLDPNLTSLTNGLFNEKTERLIKKSLFVKEMHSIAFKNESNIYGSLTIISTSKTPALNNDLIEAFIKQASVFIERRMAQNSLIQSENKYKLLVENQTDLIVKLDSKGVFLFASPSYCEMFGKSQSELLGSSFVPFIHKEDKEKTIYEMQKLNKSPYTCYVEQRAMTKHGWRWIAWSDKAILNDKNEIIEIIGVGRDITEQKLAESILKESEEKYRTLFENSSDPTLIIEKNTFILCNEATVRFLGYNNKSEILEKTPMDLSPEFQPDGQSSSEKAISKIKEAKEKGAARFDWVHIDKEGNEKWVNVSLTHLPNIDRIYTIWRDIIDKKHAELALKSSEERYRSVINNSQEGIFVVQGWHFAYTNPALSRMLGYTESELLLMEFIKVVHEDDREKIIKNNKKRLQGEDIPPYEFRIIKKSNEVLWVYLNATKIDWNSKPAALCFISDITERKEAEFELKNYQEKLEELVMERTRELEEKNKELKKFNKLFIGREFKIKELKDKIKILEA